jgi:hypothetical protein
VYYRPEIRDRQGKKWNIYHLLWSKNMAQIEKRRFSIFIRFSNYMIRLMGSEEETGSRRRNEF